MASVATYKKTLVPFLERVFFFSPTRSASQAFAASKSLVPLDSYLERFLRQFRHVSAHARTGLHMRVVSFFDAHAPEIGYLRGASLDVSLAESLSPNASVNCLLAVQRGTAIRTSRPFLERLTVENAPIFDGIHMCEVSSLNARPLLSGFLWAVFALTLSSDSVRD